MHSPGLPQQPSPLPAERVRAMQQKPHLRDHAFAGMALAHLLNSPMTIYQTRPPKPAPRSPPTTEPVLILPLAEIRLEMFREAPGSPRSIRVLRLGTEREVEEIGRASCREKE